MTIGMRFLLNIKKRQKKVVIVRDAFNVLHLKINFGFYLKVINIHKRT